jgi:hypothetical protein
LFVILLIIFGENSMKKIIIILSMLVASQAYGIGSVSNAKVIQIRIDLNGRAMIFFDQQIGGTPAACVNDAYNNALGVDASTAGGKAVLSLALTAKTTGSPITAYGLGSCGVYGGTTVETWNHGFLL